MPFTSGEDQVHRRNARSLDLDNSAAQAAAWVWHLHASKPEISTEGRYISSSEGRRRRSGSYDRKSSRFQQEAASTISTGAGGMKSEMPMWDCGSELYDTFELISFSNRLDRSLMGVVPIPSLQAQLQSNHIKSPLHQPGGVHRTLSLPRRLSPQTSKKSAVTANPKPKKLNSEYGIAIGGSRESPTGLAQIKAPSRWASLGKFMKAIKKVVVLHKQVTFVGCKQNNNIIEPSQRPIDPTNKINKGHYEGDELSFQFNKVGSSISETIGGKYSKNRSNGIESNIGDKLSMHIKNRSISETNNKGDKLLMHKIKVRSSSESKRGDELLMHKKIRSNSESRGDELLKQKKIRSNSESRGDELLMHRMIKSNNESINDGLVKKEITNPRKSSTGEELLSDNYGIKGSTIGGANVRERSIKQQNIEPQNHHFKHLHHHHHHHHHHYLHPNFTSESARLSPETMSQICAEKNWLT